MKIHPPIIHDYKKRWLNTYSFSQANFIDNLDFGMSLSLPHSSAYCSVDQSV